MAEISLEQRNLWLFWLLHVPSRQWYEQSGISVCLVYWPQIAAIWHYIDGSSLLQKCQICMLATPCWKCAMKNHGPGPLGPWNMNPIYVINSLGSMFSCILWEIQKNSESHKLRRFSARNQFRAAPFVTVWIIACSINAMERVVSYSCEGVLGKRNSRYMTLDRWHLTFSEMSVLQASHTALKMTVLLWKIWVQDHSDHQFWTPYMSSMPLDRCSPVFSLRDKNFHKVTNWSALVPEISSEQRDLWPFGLLDVVWMQWN